MRRIAFLPAAFKDFRYWIEHDERMYKRLIGLLEDMLHDPFRGIGKPEPLKYELVGLWSRRINDEHRLVYKVTEDEIVIVSCRFHY